MIYSSLPYKMMVLSRFGIHILEDLLSWSERTEWIIQREPAIQKYMCTVPKMSASRIIFGIMPMVPASGSLFYIHNPYVWHWKLLNVYEFKLMPLYTCWIIPYFIASDRLSLWYLPVLNFITILSLFALN